MWVKICGVRTLEAARHAQACGADAIGINLHPPSPRFVDPEQARAIQAAIDIPAYLVVVNRPMAELHALMSQTKAYGIQYHGNTSEEAAQRAGWPYIRAFRAHPSCIKDLESALREPVLLDAFHPDLHGGTGKQVDRQLAMEACRIKKIILAGGLTPENLHEILQQIPAWGVDVASGVEGSNGQQDLNRIAAFCRVAKQAHSLNSK